MRSTATSVEVFQKGGRIASHPRSPLKGRHTTVEVHLAPAHQAMAGWNAQRFLDWAATVGPQTQAAIEQLLASRVHPQQGYRTALGILRLGKTHGDDRLEAACLRAIQIKSVTYRSVASILKHALERQTPTQVQANLSPPTPMCAAPSVGVARGGRRTGARHGHLCGGDAVRGPVLPAGW